MIINNQLVYNPFFRFLWHLFGSTYVVQAILGIFQPDVHTTVSTTTWENIYLCLSSDTISVNEVTCTIYSVRDFGLNNYVFTSKIILTINCISYLAMNIYLSVDLISYRVSITNFSRSYSLGKALFHFKLVRRNCEINQNNLYRFHLEFRSKHWQTDKRMFLTGAFCYAPFVFPTNNRCNDW